MADLGLSTCDKISVVKSARSEVPAVCRETDCVRYQHSHLAAAQPPGWDKEIENFKNLSPTLTDSTSVTSTCLVVMFDSLQPGVQGTMRRLCQGRKKCLAMLVISPEENIQQAPPEEELPPQQKFSLQTAWLVVKVLPRGYLLRLACSGRSRLWLEYGEDVLQSNTKTKHDLNQQIFEGEKLNLCKQNNA